MQTKRKSVDWQRRLWAIALAVVLVCALLLPGTAAAVADDGGFIVDEAAPKPEITIQGNIVVDKGKPTGFYELALCVRTARTVTLKDDNSSPVPEADYAAALKEALESGDRTALDEKYTVTNYPFQSAAVAVHINLDALTAVEWGAGKPIYETWANDEYALRNVGYPRGIDLGNKEQPNIFTDLTPVITKTARFVRLDAAHPDDMTNAAALVEAVNGDDALLTLTAATSTTANVVYETPTPVVVVRFAYDMERFTKLEVGDHNDSDFWLGLDQSDSAKGPKDTQTPLTYLADSKLDSGVTKYTASDKAAADSQANQTVWYEQNMESDQVSQRKTQFYYYLGWENRAYQPQKTFEVYDLVATPPTITTESLYVPATAGMAVLAKRSTEYLTAGDPEGVAGGNSKYSFFQNLLTTEKELWLTLVNAETYRKAAGGGGTTILFYDWDDKLIGSLVVDKGDVRAEVNEYVETNLVHPDLRASKLLSKGKVPEVDSDPNRAEYANLLDSLARDYTYRGKYAYTVGDPDNVGPDGDTTNKARANGEDYPLTNKLDYVFYRRLNRIVERTDENDAKTSYYSTSSLLDENNADAALYPYVYGWAVVEDTTKTNNWKVMYDAAKTEGVWTTMGVGELSSIKPNAAGTALPSGLTIEDVTEPGFIAYETEKALKKGETVAVPTQYQYTTASTEANKYFRFADFSDIDAELARYKKADGSTKDTLVVKAVYEPGESLLDGYNYRLITDPAYTKFNSKATGAGGAYRVQLTIERSYLDSDVIKGTTRIREPVIQQDTTADAKWITDTNLGVDHDLVNPDFETALSFTETTYTKVDVDTGEQITFSLSLAARQNKVDYKLIEQYASNFVIGTQRSYSNTDVMVSNIDWFIPDNYNYYLEGDSNEKDDLYDCDFISKDGSHGFILKCTLGHMLEQATQYNHGEVARNTLNTSLDYMVARDANLRVNREGIQPEYGDNTALQNLFINAAAACEKHKNDPDYDCWDDNLNCAKLTYHQIQWFLLDGGTAAGATTDIRTVADADNKELDFCHLHASCAAAMSTVPDTWDEVIAAARANNETDLKKMTVTAIETLTSLRRNASGRQFDTPADFSAAIIDAVSKLDAASVEPTWGNLQYVILNKTVEGEAAMKEAGQSTYWWYDGSTTAPSLPSVTTNKEAQWNFLLQAAKDSYQPVPTLKDGVTSDWTSTVRLNLAQTPFNRNDTPDQSIHQNWINLTHNLVSDAKEETRNITLDDGSTEVEYIYTHTKFPDFDTFKTKLVRAVQAAETADAWPPTWEQLQWYIIKDTWDPDPDASVFGQEGFWWKDGNVPLRVSSLTTLLQILDMRDNPKLPGDKEKAQAALDKVNATFFDDSIYLRFDAAGKNGQLKLAYLPGGAKDAAWAIEQVNAARKAGATTWNQVQYYLLNGRLEENVNAMNQQGAYYWWRNGGEGNEIDFSAAGNLQMKLNTLMMATTYTAFSDPKAIESVDNAVGSDVFSFLRLIASTGGKDLLDVKDLETDVKPNAHADANALLADVAAFKAEAQTQQGKGEYDLPTAYWYQLQYYILNNEYIPVGYKDPMNVKPSYDSLIDPETGYWWYDPTLTARPEPPPPPADEPHIEILKIIQDNMGGTVTITAQQLTDSGFNVHYQQNGKAVNATITSKMLSLLANEATLGSYVEVGTAELKLTWVQVQYYLATAHKANAKGTKAGTLTDHATALAGLKAMGWDTSLFPAGVITE